MNAGLTGKTGGASQIKQTSRLTGSNRIKEKVSQERNTHQKNYRKGDEDSHVQLARLVLLDRCGQLAERLDLHMEK